MTDTARNILQRIPSLESLYTADAAIRRAVDSGDTFRVYRALLWAKLLNRIPDHRAVLNALVANRRLFAKPVEKRPLIVPLPGIGAAVVGGTDLRKEDNTIIVTYFLTYLFRIPLWPIRSYVFSRADKSYLATVPVSMSAQIYGLCVAAASVAGFVGLSLLTVLMVIAGAS